MKRETKGAVCSVLFMLTIWLTIVSYDKNSLLLGIVAGICGGVYVSLNTYTK